MRTWKCTVVPTLLLALCPAPNGFSAGRHIPAWCNDPVRVFRLVADHAESADLTMFWSLFNIAFPSEYRDCTCSPAKCGVCEAKLLASNKARSANRIKVVRISMLDATATFYLVFYRRTRWTYVGSISSPYNKYRGSSERFESDGRRLWLVVNEEWGGGSGGYRRGDVWYELGPYGRKEALRRPCLGNWVNGDPADQYDFDSTTRLRVENSTAVLTTVVTVRTAPTDGPELTWRKSSSYRYVYRYRPETQSFVIDKRRSRLPPAGAPFLQGDSDGTWYEPQQSAQQARAPERAQLRLTDSSTAVARAR